MAHRPWTSVAALIGVSTLPACSIPVSDIEPAALDRQEITNASTTADGAFVVHLAGGCTASILSRHWLLTAAHCVDGWKDNGPMTVKDGTGKQIFAGRASTFMHPDYEGWTDWWLFGKTSDTDHDVALVQLQRAGIEGPIETAALFTDWRLEVGESVAVIAFGLGTTVGGSSDCGDGETGTKRKKVYLLKTVASRKLEIDYGTSKICDGDSGSPWLRFLDGEEMIAGVTANVRPINDADAARLRPNMDWFEATTAAAGVPLSCPVYHAQGYEYRRCFEEEQRATSVSAGDHHACAVRADGRAYCWGDGSEGELGNGATTVTTRPVEVGGGLNIVQVAAGFRHSCALTREGMVWCWGANDDGQLGTAFTHVRLTQPAVPVQALVTNGARTEERALTQIQHISAGHFHTCALKHDGTVWCWGWNSFGQLGNWTTESSNVAREVRRSLPGSALPNDEIAEQLVTGEQAQALPRGPSRRRVPFLPRPGIRQVAAGSMHTCAIDAAGVLCWGRNDAGQLGDGSFADKHLPSRVIQLGEASRVSAGMFHTCAVAPSGNACWGDNTWGQFGNGLQESSAIPIRLPSSPLGAGADVTAGFLHTCFFGEAGQWCAGHAAAGELGVFLDGGYSAAPLQSIFEPVASSSAGTSFTCTLKENGQVSCAGFNAQGQLGVGDNENRIWFANVRDLNRP